MSSSKAPIIQFSPFKALMIGEKNNVLQRRPMQNTIFVTNLKNKRKPLDLKELFDLNEPKKNDVFKMPQRVKEFQKNRRLNKAKNGNEKENLCYESKGQKTNTKSECKSNQKSNGKGISNESLMKRVAKKFASCPHEFVGDKKSTKRRREMVKANESQSAANQESEKVKHVASSINQRKKTRRRRKKPGKNCQNSFKFPDYPTQAECSNFENSPELMDLIYEKFPKVKFDCGEIPTDFEETLKNSEFVKENVISPRETQNKSPRSKVKFVFNGSVPIFNVKEVDFPDKKSNFIENCFSSIDESYKKDNQLINSKSLENLFYQKGEENDFVIGNLVNPFVPKIMV